MNSAQGTVSVKALLRHPCWLTKQVNKSLWESRVGTLKELLETPESGLALEEGTA